MSYRLPKACVQRGKERTMSNSQRMAIITGASQGIGESLVTAYRKLG